MVRDARKIIFEDHGNGPVRSPYATDEDVADWYRRQTANNLNLLWQTASNYETSRISGSAPSLVSFGCLKELPKSLAIKQWMQSIWTLYYSRKSLITHEYNPSLYDFSSCGEMPYTIQELMEEVN